MEIVQSLDRQEEAEKDTNGWILDTRVAKDEGVEQGIRRALEAWTRGDVSGTRAALEEALQRLRATNE